MVTIYGSKCTPCVGFWVGGRAGGWIVGWVLGRAVVGGADGDNGGEVVGDGSGLVLAMREMAMAKVMELALLMPTPFTCISRAPLSHR